MNYIRNGQCSAVMATRKEQLMSVLASGSQQRSESLRPVGDYQLRLLFDDSYIRLQRPEGMCVEHASPLDAKCHAVWYT